jgi:hypothetical protein
MHAPGETGAASGDDHHTERSSYDERRLDSPPLRQRC